MQTPRPNLNDLIFSFTGYKPDLMLEDDTEWHLVGPHLFCFFLKKYGDPSSIKEFEKSGNPCLVFTVDQNKAHKQGIFVCVPHGKPEPFSFSLEYYSLDKKSQVIEVDQLPDLVFFVGYKIVDLPDLNKIVESRDQLIPGKYKPTWSIYNPKLKDKNGVGNSPEEILFVHDVHKQLLSVKNWIRKKHKDARSSNKEQVTASN